MITSETFQTGVQSPLPWHHSAWQQLLTQQRSGRLAHAYLLQARPGSGRRQFAQALASWLLCEQARARDTACGKCPQCLLQASGPHPDLLMVTPEADSKAIKIDSIRQMGNFIQQTAHQADALKIVLICPAEGMGIAAANSLLKNLEEPPGRSLFLLLADVGGHLLPTLRSRCQPLMLGEADNDQALRWLAEHTSAAEGELQQAVALAPGAPMLALRLLEHGVPTWRAVLEERLHGLESGQLSAHEVARHCEKIGGQPAAGYAIQFMQDRIRQEASQRLAHDSANTAAALRALTDYHRSLQDVNKRLLSGANPNVVLSLESLLSAWVAYRRQTTDSQHR